MKNIINNAKNGFTLIETLFAISIGALVSVGFIKMQIEESNNLKVKLMANEMNELISAIDKRISIDGYDINLWADKKWSDDTLSKLTNQDLQALHSKCNTGRWMPKNSDLTLSLVSCDLFKHRKFDIKIDAKMTQNLGYITNFIVDFNLKNNLNFKKNFLLFKRSFLEAKANTKNIKTGHVFYQYIDKDENIISGSQCLSLRSNCSFRIVLDRQDGKEYLNVDGSNSMIDSKVTFIDTKGNAPLKCFKWNKNDRTNKWESSLDEDCGIGINNKDGQNAPVYVNVLANNGTFRNVLLDKKCNLFTVDKESKIVTKKNETTPCGIYQEDGSIYQVVNDVYAASGIFDSISANSLSLNSLVSNNISSNNIYGRVIRATQLQTERFFTSYNQADFLGTTRFHNNTSFDKASTFNNDINVRGEHSIDAKDSSFNIKNINISNIVKSEKAEINNLIVNNRLNANEYLQLNKKEIINTKCKENGLITTSVNNDVLICKNNMWVNALSTKYKLIFDGFKQSVTLKNNLKPGMYIAYFSPNHSSYSYSQIYLTDKMIRNQTTIYGTSSTGSNAAYGLVFNYYKKNDLTCLNKYTACYIKQIYYKDE